MLPGKNNQDLDNLKINKELHIFYQLWQELTCDKTISSYQYYINHSLNAILELISVIDKRLNGVYTSDVNIITCKEETFNILLKDNILKKYYSNLINSIKRIFSNKINDQADTKKLKYHLLYFYNEIKKDYFENLTKEIKINIINKKNEETIKNTNALVSYCVSQGWSAKGLFYMVNKLEGDNTIDEKWYNFTKCLHKENKDKYLIYISFYFKRSSDNSVDIYEVLKDLNIMLGKGSEIIQNDFIDEKVKKNIKEDSTYLKIEIESFDIYSASRMAYNKVSEALNIISFYSIIHSWDARDTKVYAINTEKKYVKLLKPEVLYGTNYVLEKSSKIFECTEKIFSDNSLEMLKNRLKGTFVYSNISKATLFQEEKYMTAWIALESLSRTDLYNNIISNLIETLPPALCLRYIYKLVRNFIEDCNRCKIKNRLESLGIEVFDMSNQENVKEMMKVFNIASKYNNVLNECKVNDLLYYRCIEIYNLVTNLDAVITKINDHHKRVSWQIQRLYRIRNDIVHSAHKEAASLAVYVEHLYDYLYTFISEIVTCMVEKNLKSIEEAYVVIKSNYNEFVEISKGKLKVVHLANKVLESGVITYI